MEVVFVVAIGVVGLGVSALVLALYRGKRK